MTPGKPTNWSLCILFSECILHLFRKAILWGRSSLSNTIHSPTLTVGPATTFHNHYHPLHLPSVQGRTGCRCQEQTRCCKNKMKANSLQLRHLHRNKVPEMQGLKGARCVCHSMEACSPRKPIKRAGSLPSRWCHCLQLSPFLVSVRVSKRGPWLFPEKVYKSFGFQQPSWILPYFCSPFPGPLHHFHPTWVYCSSLMSLTTQSLTPQV